MCPLLVMSVAWVPSVVVWADEGVVWLLGVSSFFLFLFWCLVPVAVLGVFASGAAGTSLSSFLFFLVSCAPGWV